MTLNRRKFVNSSCCCIGTFLSSGRSSATSVSGLSTPICTTIESIPGGNDGFSFDRTASKPDKPFSFDKGESKFDLTPQGVSFVKDRWRSIDGLTKNTGVITLGVHFINGDASQQRVVIDAASAWTADGVIGKRLQFKFDVPQEDAQIRIEFSTGEGNWSYVGRNCLSIPPKSRTMSIDDIESYICQHEFGHAICLQHEQQYPEPGGIHWNEQRVIDDCKRMYGWSEEMTRANILSKFKSPGAKCVGDPGFNPHSIMLYMIPPEWTLDGFSSGTNTQITDRDIKCVRGVYAL
jgi:hypothetical protein